MQGNKEYGVGIDLGTTYSCVGIWLNQQVNICQDQNGSDITPSMVCYPPGKPVAEAMVGQEAFNNQKKFPENTVFSSKRLLGLKWDDPRLQDDLKLLPYKVVEGTNNKPMI